MERLGKFPFPGVSCAQNEGNTVPVEVSRVPRPFTWNVVTHMFPTMTAIATHTSTLGHMPRFSTNRRAPAATTAAATTANVNAVTRAVADGSAFQSGCGPSRTALPAAIAAVSAAVSHDGAIRPAAMPASKPV